MCHAGAARKKPFSNHEVGRTECSRDQRKEKDEAARGVALPRGERAESDHPLPSFPTTRTNKASICFPARIKRQGSRGHQDSPPMPKFATIPLQFKKLQELSEVN